MTFDNRQISYWHDSLPEAVQARPVLESDIDADVVIIGAGYTGLWTAYYLKKIDPAFNMVVLEAKIAGFDASGRNGGRCTPFISGIEHWLNNPLYWN